MRIKLSDHFTYKKLLRFVMSSIIMMIFTSIYGVVDGFFVSNFAGKTAFAAVNFIMPLIMGMGAITFMISAGGSALIAKTLGEKESDKANRLFSMLVYVTIIGGGVFTVLGLIFIKPFAVFMGAEGKLLANSLIYGRIMLSFQITFMLQCIFQTFFVTAEKPLLGLIMTVGAGVTNIVLDWLFVGVFKWGIAGAAIATIISQTVGGVIPLVYFARKNDSLLRLVKPGWDFKSLLKVCTNGSSELVTNISASIVGALYNMQLMKVAGEDGVAAYGVLMYVNFIYMAIFFGYAIGSAPIIGYHYGAQNTKELKNLLKKSLIITGVCGIVLTGMAELLAYPLAKLYVGYDIDLFEITLRGFRIYSISFLICGFNIFGSSFFTALNDGKTSAIISFLRTLVFQVAVILILPLLMGIDGIWLAVTGAEILSLIVTVMYLITKRKKYRY